MNDDPLRDRIARTDPVLDGADISPMSSDSSQHLLEDIMNTPFDNTNSTTNSIPSAARAADPSAPRPGLTHQRRRAY